ncbi:retrovirus-related pol polyprotein from transposon TNT 1-94 [Tanacetum coccineum]
MLDRTDFASWQQRIRLYFRGKENGVNILKSIDEGPFQMGTFWETLAEGNKGALHLGPERARVYSDLSPEDKDSYLHSVNASLSVKNVMHKVKQVWKPKQVKQVWKSSGKVLTSVGYQWRPTGRIFTLREQCPLTRLSKPKVVSAKQTENISSGFVPNPVPAAPYVPPTNKELEILFQLMFDEYLEPPCVKRPVSPALAVPVPVNSAGTPSSTTIDQDAPSPSHSPLSSALESLSSQQGIVAGSTIIKDNLFAPIDNDPFIIVLLQKWSKDHPLYKNFKTAITEDCWFQAMQDESHEFDRLQVWELVPRPDCVMIIALEWIYKVKLDEYSDVLKNKARLVAKGYRQEEGIDFEESFAYPIFELDETRFVLDANLLREALEITPIDQAHQFVSPPSGDAIMDFVNELGYTEVIHFLSRMVVNSLYQPWRAILSMINQCLTGKTSGHDRPKYSVLQMLWGIITSTNVDYAEPMWEEFVQAIQTFLMDKANLGSLTKKGRKDKAHVIPYCRFTKLIICHLGRTNNIHQRSASPFHLVKEDLRHGNLKFVPEGEEDEVFGMSIPN